MTRILGMNRFTSSLIVGFLVLPVGAGAIAAPNRPVRIADDGGVPLTLASAKQRVTKALVDNGERLLRAGRAECDSDGNVTVEVVTLQGIPLRHVIVEARS